MATKKVAHRLIGQHATAIPLGECLGEYKEHVEMTLKDLANLNVGDATGLIDLSSAE